MENDIKKGKFVFVATFCPPYCNVAINVMFYHTFFTHCSTSQNIKLKSQNYPRFVDTTLLGPNRKILYPCMLYNFLSQLPCILPT